MKRDKSEINRGKGTLENAKDEREEEREDRELKE